MVSGVEFTWYELYNDTVINVAQVWVKVTVRYQGVDPSGGHNTKKIKGKKYYERQIEVSGSYVIGIVTCIG